MATPKELCYEKRGKAMVKNLRSRHFDAYYCANKEEALKKALELIPEGASVGWGGTLTCQQIGLMDALRAGDYHLFDRDQYTDFANRDRVQREALTADYFITSANGLSLDGQMVNIDGTGNRVAAIVYGPKYIIVVAGMNKVEDTLEAAIQRARTIAAPMNKQRYLEPATPCAVTGCCGDCKSEGCICNQILITRNSRPACRIKIILVGEDLGM